MFVINLITNTLQPSGLEQIEIATNFYYFVEILCYFLFFVYKKVAEKFLDNAL